MSAETIDIETVRDGVAMLARAAQESSCAIRELGNQLRIVSLYLPSSAPWPWQSHLCRRLHPLAAELTKEFAAIELWRNYIVPPWKKNRPN